jgi:hypothetical protein
MASTGSVSIAANIFTAPAAAFAAIKEKPSPWLPLLLILVGYCLVSFLYLNGVDLPWFMDRQMQQAGSQITDEQRAQAVEAALRLSPMTYGAIGAVTSCLGVVIVFALYALYFLAVGAATKTGIKYGQWFGLLLWASLPIVLGLLAAIVYLLTNDVRFVVQESLNPLSFGNLLSIEAEGAPTFQRVLLSLDPTSIWALVLWILGYQAFSKKSIVHAALVVLAPIIVIVLLTAIL